MHEYAKYGFVKMYFDYLKNGFVKMYFGVVGVLCIINWYFEYVLFCI